MSNEFISPSQKVLFLSFCLLYFTMVQDPPRPWAPHYRGFIFIFRHTTFCKTPLDEWSARRR